MPSVKCPHCDKPIDVSIIMTLEKPEVVDPNYVFSKETQTIMEAYRKADDITKSKVDVILSNYVVRFD